MSDWRDQQNQIGRGMTEAYGNAALQSGLQSANVKTSQLTEQFRAVSIQCERLDKARVMLRERLAPISRGPRPETESKAVPEEMLVPLANDLRNLSKRLAETHDDLMQLLQSIEL